MTTATGEHRPPTAVELLERAVAYTGGALALVREADLGRPTPCAGWDLATLLRHMHDGLDAMAAGALHPALSLVPAHAPYDGHELVASICQRARHLLGHWHPEPVGRVGLGDASLDRELFGAVGALEITVHGWDVATALGRTRPIPPVLAMDLWPVARDHISDADRPTRFGPVPDVADGVPSQVRLLAQTGRHT